MPNIVISYRRDDSKWIADRVFDRFESHYGRGNVFMDIDSIPFGLDFREHIRETLERCDVMVALVGPNWVGRNETGEHILNDTDWVRIEIEAALNKKIPVIPLLIEGARMPKADELPDPLKNFVFRQSAAIDRDNFRSQMDRVITSIDQHLSRMQLGAGAKALQKPEPVLKRSPEGASHKAEGSGQIAPDFSQSSSKLNSKRSIEDTAVYLAIAFVVGLFILAVVIGSLSR